MPVSLVSGERVGRRQCPAGRHAGLDGGDPRLVRRRRALRRTAALLLLSAALSGVCAAYAGPENPLRFAHTLLCTTDPEAATTVPGWLTVAGSPALRCAASLHASWTGERRPRVVVASGPYGTSTLERMIPLRARAGVHRRLTLSASFGASGSGSVRGVLSAEFVGASGRSLGAVVVLRGPRASGDSGPPRFEPRSVTHAVPVGTVALKLRVALGGATDRAASYVGAMGLAMVPPEAFPPLAAPAAHVPRFAHVFLIMMENTNYGQVIGDWRDAPYINGLAARGALLANYQGIYHPSDQNYLAIAGGGAFVEGPVYFPDIRVDDRNLGDLLQASGQSWKAYEEGMGTPCNTSTRYDRNYEPDDAPFILFSDIQDNPARCRAHLVGMREWPQDLKRIATTPAFAWLAADDYNDGEMPGNGSPKSLRVQNAWLKRTLEPLFESPAWRARKSLLILTWDESDTTAHNHIATIVLGSRGTVKSGYVSHVRYDHYSTARTIEAALGLPAMTSNDEYARPFNDVFVRR